MFPRRLVNLLLASIVIDSYQFHQLVMVSPGTVEWKFWSKHFFFNFSDQTLQSGDQNVLVSSQ